MGMIQIKFSNWWKNSVQLGCGNTTKSGLVFAFALLALVAQPAAAVSTDTWLGGGDTNFSTAANWSFTTGSGPVATGDLLVFGPAGLGFTAPNNDEPGFSFGSITFSSAGGAYTVGGNAFTLGPVTGGVVIAVNSTNGQTINNPITLGASAQTISLSAGNLTLGGPVGGAGSSLSLSGGGTLTLIGTNTYSGSTTISNGTLAITGAGSLGGGSYAATITNKGVLNFNSSAQQTLAGVISGTGALNLNGGSLTLTATGTRTGATTVNGGTLVLSSGNAATSGLYASSGLTINSGGIVQVGVDNSLAGSAGTRGALPITINAGGVLTNTGTADGGVGAYAHIRGVLTLAGGTLAGAGSNALVNGIWDLDDGVVVNGGTNSSTISATNVIPDESGGTLFNVANGGTASGIDLNVTCGLATGSSVADTGIIKTGNGTMAIMTRSTYVGSTIIRQGTLVVTNLASISTTGSSSLQIGATSGSSGALYQTTNTGFSILTSSLGGWQIGSAPGAYGYHNMTGGGNYVGGQYEIGGSGGGQGTFAQFDMSGGGDLLPATAYPVFMANRGGGGESSVFNFSGGEVEINNGSIQTATPTNGLAINWSSSGSAQTNITTLSGTALFLIPSLPVELNCGGSPFTGMAGNSANVTVLNLNGGVLQTHGFINGTANPNVDINFNGGTLTAGNAAINAAFLGGIGSVCIYGGGGTINDNGTSITIAQPLLAPTGNGVSSIAIAGGGSGYITPPQVILTGGGGSGATAYATIAGGAVTGIVVTCPGINYTSAPVVALVNSSSATTATAGLVTIAPNVGGMLTKSGTGTLTLTGASTYAGGTLVTNGSLVVNNLTGSATGSGPVIISTNCTLSGSGTIGGSVQVNKGGKTLPGTSGATNTIGSNLTYNGGAVADFYLSASATGPGNDQIVLNGANSVLNCTNLSIGINCGTNLDQITDYPLISLTGGSPVVNGGCNPTPVWLGTVPVNSPY